MKIKYYDNRPEHGVMYDWDMIQKEYDKLGVPKEYYYPCFKEVKNGAKIIQSLSIRSTGKTTSWLLVGLCMSKLYKGFCTQYVRTTTEELTPSTASKLVEVIRTYNDGQYVERLTDGEYNDIFYHWKQFFYCYRNKETGVIEKKSDVPIIQFLAVSEEETYKSSYNSSYGMGDLFLYDEFITKHYYPDAFFHFFNLFKTVARNRKSPLIVMCANTTNLFSLWFQEMGISKEVKEMKAGESKRITTPKGTRLYIEYIKLTEDTNRKNREEQNRLFFGFMSSKLSSITGEGSDWNFDFYPHIPVETGEDKLETLVHNLYIDFNGEFLRVKICRDNLHGLHGRVHKATRVYEDSIILSLDLDKTTTDKRYLWGFSTIKPLKKVINDILERKMFFFSSNEVGSEFYEYIEVYKDSKL